MLTFHKVLILSKMEYSQGGQNCMLGVQRSFTANIDTEAVLSRAQMGEVQHNLHLENPGRMVPNLHTNSFLLAQQAWKTQ